MNFYELNDYPIFDGLLDEFNNLMNKELISWPDIHLGKQICVNTIPGEDDIHLGSGSLYYKHKTEIKNNSGSLVRNYSEINLEQDFTEVCSVFKNTLFEEVYNFLDSKYFMGRMRIIQLNPRECLTWHRDTHIRIHYPMKTSKGAFLLIDNEIKHLPKNTWWKLNTGTWHTAINSSNEERIHLVTAILGEK